MDVCEQVGQVSIPALIDKRKGMPSHGAEQEVKDLVKRFKHLGRNSPLHFLHSVGEDVPRPAERRRR